ncbi:MAG: prohibitin family protein [Flavobacteriaceae bacterium]|nr:prohibitin family protein [Flavobacteriaceae bacterium]
MAQNYQTPQFPKGIVLVAVLVIVGLIMITKSTVTIPAGQAGVLYETFNDGVNTDEFIDEGFHFIAPWNKVVIYNVRQQEIFEKGMAVLSSNGLEIKLDASVWFQPKLDKLGFLHKEKGRDYVDLIIKPAIRSATRSVVGRYTPEQLYSTKRDAIQKEIYEESNKILESQYVQLNDVLVRDVILPPTIKLAIENKLKQEQESLEYEFKIQKAEKEALRQIIQAQGKADANRILNASLTDKILKDKGIEATLKLAESNNAKTVIIGGSDGLPLILGNN